MKTTILIKENRTQLVLHPESEHDKATLDILQKLPHTYRVDLYDRQGGYTMFDAQSAFQTTRNVTGKDLMIVFDEASDLVEKNKLASEHRTAKPIASPPPADSQGDKHD